MCGRRDSPSPAVASDQEALLPDIIAARRSIEIVLLCHMTALASLSESKVGTHEQLSLCAITKA